VEETGRNCHKECANGCHHPPIKKTSETYHAVRQPEKLQMAGYHPNLISPCAVVENLKEGGNRQIHTFGRLNCQTCQTLATFRRILNVCSATPVQDGFSKMNGSGSTPAISFLLRIPFRVSCQVLSYSIGGMREKVGNSGVEDGGAPGGIWLTQ
jgi:hypothetical protein